MTPHRLSAPLVGGALVSSLLLAGLAAGSTSPASAVSTSSPTSSASPGSAAAPAARVPHLPPVHVPADGTVSVPVTNDGAAPLTLQLTAQLGRLTLGTGVLTLGPGEQDTGVLTLSSRAMRRLVDRTWMTTTVRVASTDGSGAGAVTRRIELVAPSVTTADPGNPDNPLAGRPWATYEGDQEPITAPYDHARGLTKDKLARIEFQPKAKWFVSNLAPVDLGNQVRKYIAGATAADPDALVQLTMFTLDPWENAACEKAPTRHEIRLDRAYTREFVQAVGDTHAVVVVEPDGPYAGCEPGTKHVLAGLVGDAIHQLEALPHTAAYLDMGSADWHRGVTSDEIPLMLRENIREADGFSMDVTHTDSVGNQIRYAAKLNRVLTRHGVLGKHAVIDTSDNGRPFGGAEWRQEHPAVGPYAAPACADAEQRLCVALGIPPTTDVADKRWGLSPRVRRIAATQVDAYLWIKRPWLDFDDHYRFSMDRALKEIDTAAFF